MLNITCTTECTTYSMGISTIEKLAYNISGKKMIWVCGVISNHFPPGHTHCPVQSYAHNLVMYSYPQSIYHSMILPKLGYCSTVWDPHHSNDITALDRVQRFAGRVITHQWHSDHSTLLNSLNWQPLQTRRRLIKLKVCYNILNNYSCIPPQ